MSLWSGRVSTQVTESVSNVTRFVVEKSLDRMVETSMVSGAQRTYPRTLIANDGSRLVNSEKSRTRCRMRNTFTHVVRVLPAGSFTVASLATTADADDVGAVSSVVARCPSHARLGVRDDRHPTLETGRCWATAARLAFFGNHPPRHRHLTRSRRTRSNLRHRKLVPSVSTAPQRCILATYAWTTTASTERYEYEGR